MEWGIWIMKEVGLAGFRLDAVQHYSWKLANSWSQHLKQIHGGDLLCVGEFWNGDMNVLEEWLGNMSPDFKLYDVPLLYRIARLSQGEDKDLREVFRDTLVERWPGFAVSFTQVHDTQRGPDMDTPMRGSFIPHGYALLLLRQGGHPCVFFGDLFGVVGPYPEPTSCWGRLPGLLLARRLYAHGPQSRHFESSDCIGWTRRGNSSKPDGCAVILSWTHCADFEYCVPDLKMNVGSENAGEIWTDVLGYEGRAVIIDEDGNGRFPCQRNSISCFVSEAASGRENFLSGLTLISTIWWHRGRRYRPGSRN